MSKDSPYTIPNSAKILRTEYGVRERQTEPLRSFSEQIDVPVSIIVYSRDPKKTIRCIETVRDQTHRKWQMVFVNCALADRERGKIRKIFTNSLHSKMLPKADVFYLESIYKKIGVFAAKYPTIAFLYERWCWEPGHLETLLRAQSLTKKRPISAYRILGEYGGWDVSEVIFPNRTYQSNHVALTLFTFDEMQKYLQSRSDLNFAETTLPKRKKTWTKKPTVVFDYGEKFRDEPAVTLSRQIQNWRAMNKRYRRLGEDLYEELYGGDSY